MSDSALLGRSRPESLPPYLGGPGGGAPWPIRPGHARPRLRTPGKGAALLPCAVRLFRRDVVDVEGGGRSDRIGLAGEAHRGDDHPERGG